MIIRNHTKLPTEETESIEFKKSLAERGEILECVSAFSNTKGGRIYIGIEPTGKIIGVEIGNNTIENLANEIKQNTDPKVFPSVEVIKIKSKDVISLFVPEYPTKPVWAKDKVFIRVGRTNQKASADIIRHFIKDQHTIKWDKILFSKASMKDISWNNIKLFIEKASLERNTIFEGPKNIKNTLQRLNLIENDTLTNASILLFGKNPQSIFINSDVKCARFRGNEPIDFIDMQSIEGTIIEQVSAVLNFIRRHINISIKISGAPEREEIWEYPQEALREAIINAICHRDYEDPGNVQVRIFDNRLEVWNPGVLPQELKIKMLKKEHQSKPRNELIARCFYLIKYIEQWGTGTNRIIRLCKQAKLPEPKFSIKGNSFIVTFYRLPAMITKEYISATKIPTVLGLSWDQVGTKLGLSWEQQTFKPQFSVKEAIKILAICNKPKSILELMLQFNWKNRTKFRNKFINPLLKAKLLELVNPEKPQSRNQKYITTVKGQELLNKSQIINPKSRRVESSTKISYGKHWH